MTKTDYSKDVKLLSEEIYDYDTIDQNETGINDGRMRLPTRYDISKYYKRNKRNRGKYRAGEYGQWKKKREEDLIKFKKLLELKKKQDELELSKRKMNLKIYNEEILRAKEKEKLEKERQKELELKHKEEEIQRLLFQKKNERYLTRKKA